MISVSNLVKEFGSIRAVDDVSFSVEKGTVLGFLGPNGAGKTTTIRMLAGFLSPSAGTATVHDFDIVKNPIEAQRYIGYMPETTPLYQDMTVETFLRFIAEIRGYTGSERQLRTDQAISSCFLEPVRHQVIDTLSKGYRQRTCFAQALLHDPPILLLDEPTEGLDPNQKKVVRDMIRNMAREKVIMLSTHVLEEVEAICSRVIIISAGKIVVDSTPEELKRRSASFNVVTMQLSAPEAEVQTVFGALELVDRVEMPASGDGRVTIRLIPIDKQPLTMAAIDAAQSRGWEILNLHTSGGRLDDVFREITTTEDAS